jgi:hypothetical protein
MFWHAAEAADILVDFVMQQLRVELHDASAGSFGKFRHDLFKIESFQRLGDIVVEMVG